MGLFTEIEREIQKTRERDACDPISELTAMVEARAARKCSARQIVEAVRDFAGRLTVEARQERAGDTGDEGQPSGPVWIASGSAEWDAWEAHWRATKGKRQPPRRLALPIEIPARDGRGGVKEDENHEQ